MQPTTSVSVRPATLDDCPVVYRFLCDLEETTLDPVAFGAVFARNTTSPSVWYRVAEVGAEVIGFVSCHAQWLLHHTGRVGEIQELYVQPDYRNQRIGHQLVAEVVQIARQEGFINLEVTTNARRTDTIRFYEQTGFRASHRKLVMGLMPEDKESV
ncbi:GNAT family N-acetyltransferase [Rudanella paleaurantiibacter]|uniref:GNAT family N-acetyltransferase n=1 Tax=Rudanella paleaurantiibacter TaxID=2614655 RepID=A0A7J5TXD4_9BACT|nr:GNAT family N-acetyltransferase [Rudanella paleaurantiibacter]KAB7729309.1 GNAT family N-acetyltransferase [Rudanella paleaurantiibacter]